MAKKNMIALILAGGQGSRLSPMTKVMAKPAVHFGGKYRIIDFALSNCSNSGIDTVGILTQFKPQALNAHIGIGTPWDLDRVHGGVAMLPPYMSEQGGDWYKGTANAVYQNLSFCDQYDPEYLLILSGDHIYKMDYREMLKKHIAEDAAATIGVINVPIEEASRFGIMNTDKTGRIEEFEEKPAKPKSNLASMGIYVFNKNFLKKYLEEDAKDETILKMEKELADLRAILERSELEKSLAVKTAEDSKDDVIQEKDAIIAELRAKQDNWDNQTKLALSEAEKLKIEEVGAKDREIAELKARVDFSELVDNSFAEKVLKQIG